MNIGIIGTGHIGGTLTRRLRELYHVVSIANSRGPQTLEALAKETGATAVSVNELARDRDVVIVTIPERCVVDLPPDLFEGVPESVVVVDTGNRREVPGVSPCRLPAITRRRRPSWRILSTNWASTP